MGVEWNGVGVAVTLVFLACAHLGLGMAPVVLEVSNEVCEAGLPTYHNYPFTRECEDTCVASGDPHFNTFDCVKFEYHGKCKYTLVKACADGIAHFEIIADFHRMRYHKKLSIIRSLLITCEGTDIYLDDKFGVTINNVIMTSENATVSYASVHRYCNGVIVAMNNGITIYWSRPHRAVIKISPDAALLAGNLCGLCGNHNNIKFDDFTTPDDMLVTDEIVFGDSWRRDIDCDECDDCAPSVCMNNPQYYQQAKDYCNIFIDGSMPACGTTDMQTLYEQCVNIMCASLPEVTRFCQLINLYIETCVADGVEIRLHLHGVCNDGCYKNMMFIPYGSSFNSPACNEKCRCDPVTGITCDTIECHDHASCIVDQSGSGSCVCNAPDYEGNGLMCTMVDPCKPNPCYNGAICIRKGLDSFKCDCVNEFFGTRCQNPPPCASNPCDNGGTCVNEGANYRCVCPFGVWAGPTCNIRCYRCWACGDPHYLTFDRRWYDFQGKCMYTLAKSTEGFPNPFQVVGNNVASYWNTRVSITREVYVYLDFGTPEGTWVFCFRYGHPGILVNDEQISIPYKNRDGDGNVRVEIKQAGYYTLLSTNFGLYVQWNGVHCLSIIVPEFFKDQVEGLCGLFNGDRNDDWTKSDGQLATSPNEFGNSWAFEEMEACHEPCTAANCETGNPCDNEPEKSADADTLCMYLNKDYETGPFAACFNVSDPAQFFTNCKYDICAGAEMNSICDDMVNYAVECRALGVEITGDWRDMVDVCNENSPNGTTYDDCGSACPATCADPDGPMKCKEQCVEGNQCNEGLLMTSGGCVPPDQCGCVRNGVYYEPNTEFITEHCTEKCMCKTGGQIECTGYGPCGANADCTVRYGKRDCYCQNRYSGDGFDCTSWSTCRACGDPHYVTLDGRRYDFQGKCRYTLVKTTSGDITFEVIVNNTAWRWNPRTSLTQQLFITVYGLEVEIGYKEPVRVNGEIVTLPFYLDTRVVIYRSCIYTILETDYGLQIKWDGWTCVSVRLPSTFNNQVAGLCGDFNGVYSDDFKDPQNNLLTNVNDFGNSWKYGTEADCDCTPETCVEEDPCDAKPGVSDICLPLTDQNGPFKSCHGQVDPAPYLKDCSYDACAAENTTEVLCEHFERYVTDCRAAGVAINGWRNIRTECAIDCGPRRRYTDCGSPCQATCVNPNMRKNKCGQRECVQGCECLPGLVLSGDDCVEPSQCGCQYNGKYYPPMRRFVTGDCGLRCRCIGGDNVECEPFGCGKNAVCDVRDGVRGCYCEDGFKLLMNGKTCESTSPCTPNPCSNGGQCKENADMTSYTCLCPYGRWTGPTCNIRCYRCYAWGDPHYKSFDGRYFDFQGRCSYTLAKSLTGAPHEFEVTVQNIGWGRSPVTVTREVDVYVTHQGISYKFSFKWRSAYVQVNDLDVNLPYYVYNYDGSVHLSITRARGYVFQSEFGLLLDWGGSHTVNVYLPEEYKDYVNGLCGFFNGARNDDYTTPDGNLLSNVNDWGNSWTYGECTTPCTPQTCPDDPCRDDAAAKMTATMKCRPLDATNVFSVFKECLAASTVDPTPILKNCEFDMCVAPNDDELRCEHFNLYATACREAGVNVGNWRNSIEGCGIECGVNMEYQNCGSGCPETCGDTKPRVCAAVCVEGCQCVTGFVLDNERCVPREQCGCKDNGKYYQVGEVVVSDDCTTECTCETGGEMNCEQLEGCRENEVCQINNGRRTCYCPVGYFNGNDVCQPLLTCVACGDPHYLTFDGTRYDFQGKCSYILAHSEAGAPNQFQVIGDNMPWARNPRMTATRYVHIMVYGLEIQFSWDTSNVLVNSETVNLPYSFENNKVVIYQAGWWYKVLYTDFGLQIWWDGYWCLGIKVPANFVNEVNGLCGHLSLNRNDDFTNPDGVIETSINAFGNSWTHGEGCEPCPPEECPDEHPCDLDPDAAAIAEAACRPLIDTTGVFSAFLDEVDSSELYHECRYDLCADPEIDPCGYLQRYASKCRDEGKNVNGWRESVPQCHIDCGDFMVYSDCASGCPATCANPNAPDQDCRLGCVPGCQCRPGLLASGNTCVPMEECGCTLNGKYFENGQEYVDKKCNNKCRCQGGSIQCDSISCDDNAVCEIQNGVRGCYCTGSYIGDGTTCTTPCQQTPIPCKNGAQCVDANNAAGYICRCPEGYSGRNCQQDLMLCRASGDPHYRNFAGQRFDFQGDCDYIFAHNCSSSIPEFTVIVENERSRWNSRVSITRSVTVLVYGQTILLGRGRVVQINDGGVATLPVHNDNYSIQLYGYWVVLKTDFNLVVMWNGGSTVKALVPTSFRGNLCGLCGDGNGGDRINFDGELENNINIWGHSWATDPAVCERCDDCPTDPDLCATVDPAIAENADTVCSIITAETGVFYPATTVEHVIETVAAPEQAPPPPPPALARKRSLPSLHRTGGIVLHKRSQILDVFGDVTGSCDIRDDTMKTVHKVRSKRLAAGPEYYIESLMYTVQEDSGYVDIVVCKTVGNPMGASLMLKFTDGTAVGPNDYDNMDQTINSISGSPAKCRTETVFITDDVLIEGDEIFFVTITNVDGCGTMCEVMGDQATATVRIVDDDQPAPDAVHVQALHVRWSALGATVGELDPFLVNATVGFSDTSSHIQGTGLWKLRMYGSPNADGSGEEFQPFEQILSDGQQAQSYSGGTNLTFVEAQAALDINALGCDLPFRYLCFDFARGNSPSVDFMFTTFQDANPTKITVCSDRCTQQEVPAVVVAGLEVRIATAPLQQGVKDFFITNSTVHFTPTSPDVSGTGLWKLSVYGSMNADGTGDQFQRIDQVLTEAQQQQPLQGASDVFFSQSPGELDIHAIGCSEYQYLCLDFAQGDNPDPDFDFETLQTDSQKYTLCTQRTCEEDMGVDITAGFLLVADLQQALIRIAPLDTLDYQVIPVENVDGPVAVDFDPEDQMFYWTDILRKTISRAYLDGSGQEVILDLGADSVADGIAIDVVHRYVYWTDAGYDRIERANLDGSYRTTIVDMGSQEPRAIVVDSTNGQIYWTDWGATPKIERCNVDGSSRVTLIDAGLHWPNGLAIDFPNGRMYWCDAGLNQIESAKLDGSDRKTLLNSGATDIHPFALAIHGDTILWSDWVFPRLVTMNTTRLNYAELTGAPVFQRAAGLHIQFGGCETEDGSFIPEGHTAIDATDPCLQCTCLHMRLTCMTMQCPVVKPAPGQECTPYMVPGECCTRYDCRTTGCDDGEGNMIANGETTGTPCSWCTCNGGQLSCQAIRCAVVAPPLGQNCSLVTPKGECCPVWDCQAGQGPFVNCHGVLDPTEYFKDCTYDWCATQNIEQLCEDIAAYAVACQQRGVEIGQWRAGVGCDLECPSNAHYELCPSACQPACTNWNADDEPCDEFCTEACVCDTGYILDGDMCKPDTECGCLDEETGVYHQQGTIIVSEGCTHSCVCAGPHLNPDTNGWNCQVLTCNANEECGVRDGLHGCYCKEGFVQQVNGVCQDINECAAGTDNCNANAMCTNTPGGFTCTCNEGYTGDGVTCEASQGVYECCSFSKPSDTRDQEWSDL